MWVCVCMSVCEKVSVSMKGAYMSGWEGEEPPPPPFLDLWGGEESKD